MQSSDFPKDGFVRQRQLIPHPIPFSPATLWRKVAAGEFPAPLKLSERVTAWRCSDVTEWMSQQSAKNGSVEEVKS